MREFDRVLVRGTIGLLDRCAQRVRPEIEQARDANRCGHDAMLQSFDHAHQSGAMARARNMAVFKAQPSIR